MLGTLVLLAATLANADAGLPDPTRPADYSVARIVTQELPRQRAEFSLNAIRISASDRSAVINGKLVRVGDEIGTATVREISITEVTLDYERKLLSIPLYAQGFTKRFTSPETKK